MNREMTKDYLTYCKVNSLMDCTVRETLRLYDLHNTIRDNDTRSEYEKELQDLLANI